MRTIHFTYDNKDYNLGFTLGTIEQMERAGFVRDELATKNDTR